MTGSMGHYLFQVLLATLEKVEIRLYRSGESST